MDNVEQDQGEFTVAEALVDFLARSGVTTIFGVAGTTVMPILDAIAQDRRLRYIAGRHEQSAADMASGYARATGRLAVVLTHVGPGITSCLTSMVAASREGVPLLFITGNEESDTLVREPYHDWDLMGAVEAIVPFSYRVMRPDELPHALRRALGHAIRGPMQPAHIDVPEDVALSRVTGAERRAWQRHVEPLLTGLENANAGRLTRQRPDERAIQEIHGWLTASAAPLVVVGEESASTDQDHASLVALCETLEIPYVTTHGGRGGIGSGQTYVGTLGRFGSSGAVEFARDADLVICVGAELTDIDTMRWRLPDARARVVVVHSDPKRIDRRVAPHLGVVSTGAEFAGDLLSAFAGGKAGSSPDWLARARATRCVDAYTPSALDARLVHESIQAVPEGWAISADPGFGALSLTANVDLGKRRFLYPHGFGYMGFSIPNSMGAVMSHAVDGALAILGDGAFFMSLASLATLGQLRIPVAVIVLDDGGFGSQRKKQTEGYGGVTMGVDYDNPDIVDVCKALEIESSWIESTDDVTRICRDLPVLSAPRLVAVKRAREQQVAWYEGSARRR